MQTHLYTLSLEVEGHHIIALQQTLKCTNQIQKKEPSQTHLQWKELKNMASSVRSVTNMYTNQNRKRSAHQISTLNSTKPTATATSTNNAYVQKPLHNLKTRKFMSRLPFA